MSEKLTSEEARKKLESKLPRLRKAALFAGTAALGVVLVTGALEYRNALSERKNEENSLLDRIDSFTD